VGDIVSESPGDFISVHPGDFVGICTEKRQGTKSREVVHLRCSGFYGDLSRALVLEIV